MSVETTKDHASAERRCAVSRKVWPRDALIRFVVGPDNTIVPDLSEILPGRGIWVFADRETLEKASHGGAFAQSAKMPIRVPDKLIETLERLLSRRCIETIGLSRRAGTVVLGFEKVKSALAAHQLGVLLTAADNKGRDGRELAVRGRHIPVMSILTVNELGQSLGRENAVHVGLEPGRLTDRLIRDCVRLAGLRGRPEAVNTPPADISQIAARRDEG